MNERIFSDRTMVKVSSGDFEVVMKSVGFSETPREKITVKDMIDWDTKKRFMDRMFTWRVRYFE